MQQRLFEVEEVPEQEAQAEMAQAFLQELAWTLLKAQAFKADAAMTIVHALLEASTLIYNLDSVNREMGELLHSQLKGEPLDEREVLDVLADWKATR